MADFSITRSKGKPETKKLKGGSIISRIFLLKSECKDILGENFSNIRILDNGDLEITLNELGRKCQADIQYQREEHWGDLFESIDQDLISNGFDVDNDWDNNLTTITKDEYKWKLKLDDFLHPYEQLILSGKTIITQKIGE